MQLHPTLQKPDSKSDSSQTHEHVKSTEDLTKRVTKSTAKALVPSKIKPLFYDKVSRDSNIWRRERTGASTGQDKDM